MQKTGSIYHTMLTARKDEHINFMAKKIQVEIPRSALLELAKDTDFGRHLYNAILTVENTHEITTVEIGHARQKAVVSILE